MILQIKGANGYDWKTIGIVIVIVGAVVGYLFSSGTSDPEVRDLRKSAERVMDNSGAVGAAHQGAIDSNRELGDELKRIVDGTDQLEKSNQRATELAQQIDETERANLETIKRGSELPGRIKQIIQDVRSKGPINNKDPGSGN